MIRENLYHKTVDILVQSYFNDTLQHSSCSACAVANLLLAAHNIQPVKYDWGYDWPYNLISYSQGGLSWYDICKHGKQPSDEWIANNLTGYTWHELSKIESAFEEASRGISKDEWMFNGLMNVIDCLDEIHENKDSQITKDTKKKFNRNPVVQVCDAYEAETTSKS